MKNLANKLVKNLIRKKLKISFAESCTGGMLSSIITSISGSSKVFNLGLITYSNKVKIDILKVPKKIISKYGAVSSECCLSMVKNLSKISKADISVSITGIAGPNGGTKFKPVGLVYIGIKNRNKIIIKENLFKNQNRISIQKASVITSLKIINKII
jgi:nicotinamide-nucleotide amidase